MQPNLSDQLAYLIIESNNGNDFTFTTQKGVKYLAYFTDASGYAPGASFVDAFKMFGFQRTSGWDAPDKSENDGRIMITLFEILYYYFTANPVAVITYLCSDKSVWPTDVPERQRNIRFSKRRSEVFSQWFDEWQLTGVMPAEKVDFLLYGQLYAACFFRLGNQYEAEVRKVIDETLLEKQE